MMTQLSRAEQDYLKAVYRLSSRHGRASTSQLAEWLAVNPASVTGMLQKMAQASPPLVNYEKHKGAILTQDGADAALSMVRQHRLLELFLVEKLGYTWDEVHDEAERLEHAVSREFRERIAAILGDPCRDPHGDPIPDTNLNLQPTTEFPLLQLQPGQKAVIRRVRDEDADLLRYLAQLGLRPSAKVTAVAHNKLDHTLTLQVAGQDDAIVVGLRAAEELFVDLDPDR
jgi:DtxR family Mn-dependent transcriptional regulator